MWVHKYIAYFTMQNYNIAGRGWTKYRETNLRYYLNIIQQWPWTRLVSLLNDDENCSIT